MVFLEAVSTVGCCWRVLFLFQDQLLATEDFPVGRHCSFVSIAAIQGQHSAQVAPEQLHSSGQVIPLLITATQLCEASMDYMQLSFSSGTAHSIVWHVDIELMKSQLVALSKKLVPIGVIKPLLLLHRVCEKQLLPGTESSYHWSNSRASRRRLPWLYET